MKNCPNCGRPTLRTEDWACQWCGYPLLSKSYKKIPKTYREIKEEALREWGISREERGAEDVAEPGESEREPIAETAAEPEMAKEAGEETREEQIIESEAEKEAESEAEAEKVKKPVSKTTGKRTRKSVPKAKPEPVAEVEAIPLLAEGKAGEPERVSDSKPEMKEKEAEAEKTPGAEKRRDIETAPEQVTEGELFVEPEKLSGETPISVEELNAIFAGDKGANAKFTGKTIQVTGVVDKVFLRDHLDIRYIILASAGRKGMWKVRCTFEEGHSSTLSRLSEGQKVIVQGEYDGCERNILLKHCVLVG